MKRHFKVIDESYHRSARSPASVAVSVLVALFVCLAVAADWLPIAPRPFLEVMAGFVVASLSAMWLYRRGGFVSPAYAFMNWLESTLLFAGIAVTVLYTSGGHVMLWAFYIIMAIMHAQATGLSLTGIGSVAAPAAVVAVVAFVSRVPGESWQMAVSGTVLSSLLYGYIAHQRELALANIEQGKLAERELATALAQLEHERRLREIESDWLTIIRTSAVNLYYAGESVRMAADGADACAILGDEPETAAFWAELDGDIARTLATGLPTSIFAKKLPLSERYVDIRIVRLETERLNGARVALVLNDASERLELERKRAELQERLMLADKMSSLGLLAAGVGHEISNPLTYILGNIEHLLANRGLDDTSRAALLDVQMGFHQIERIVGDLRSFSHARPRGEGEIFDLRTVCLRTERMMAAELRYAATVSIALPDEPVSVFGSPERIQQILLNLLINARQALPRRPAADNLISIVLSAENEVATLAVIDNGQGIPQGVLRKIFDPFFTTKAPGEGTGLGLSVSFQIASDHGGTISVRSRPGEGTTFTLKLPIKRAPEGRPRVLVVDDEERNLTLFRRTLHAFEIETAASLQAARALLPRGYAAVLCDVRLQDGVGFDLWQQAPEALRDRFIFLTALPPDAPEFAGCPPNARVLHKPIQLDLLEQELAHAVSGKRPAHPV